MSPEARSEQLLDAACAVIRRDGVAACTIQSVSDEAGVTPQLVHKYMGTREQLLRRLYEREAHAQAMGIDEDLRAATSFEDIVRIFVRSNFDELSERSVIGPLRAAIEVADVARDLDVARDRLAGRILARRFPRAAADPSTIEFVLRIGSAASIAAATLAARRDRDRERDIEATMRFLMAGLRELVPGI